LYIAKYEALLRNRTLRFITLIFLIVLRSYKDVPHLRVLVGVANIQNIIEKSGNADFRSSK
jgi:hypothetical protein